MLQLSDSSSVGMASEALVQELKGKVESLRREGEASLQQCNQFRNKIKVREAACVCSSPNGSR